MPSDPPIPAASTSSEAGTVKPHGADKCKQKTQRLLDRFDHPGCALRATVWALFILIAAYVGVHLIWREEHTEWRNAVRFSEDGTFTAFYREEILDRFFARNKVNEWKQRLDEKILALRKEALARRREVLVPLVDFVQRTLSHQHPPGVLGMSLRDAVDENYLRLSTANARRWLEERRADVPPGKSGLIESSLRSLAELHDWESSWREQLQTEVDALRPQLSFDWLFIEEWHWVLEVVAWCLFGVLANTFIALIQATRSEKFDVREFLLVIPKATLAPVLAIVVIAWWATGYSQSQINFLNLPYFLVFSFFLGFVTETLYTKIKELGNLVVGPSTAASTARLELAARREKYQFLSPAADPGSVRAPTTLPELRDALKSVARSGMERGVVNQLSGSAPES
jgi:hypothetical protein